MKKITKEQRVANKIFFNFSMAGISFLFISVLGKILVHGIEFLISMPFILNESSVYVTMDKLASLIGNNIYFIGIIVSILFSVKGLFLIKKYNSMQKKEA